MSRLFGSGSVHLLLNIIYIGFHRSRTLILIGSMPHVFCTCRTRNSKKTFDLNTHEDIVNVGNLLLSYIHDIFDHWSGAGR